MELGLQLQERRRVEPCLCHHHLASVSEGGAPGPRIAMNDDLFGGIEERTTIISIHGLAPLGLALDNKKVIAHSDVNN